MCAPHPWSSGRVVPSRIPAKICLGQLLSAALRPGNISGVQAEDQGIFGDSGGPAPDPGQHPAGKRPNLGATGAGRADAPQRRAPQSGEQVPRIVRRQARWLYSSPPACRRLRSAGAWPATPPPVFRRVPAGAAGCPSSRKGRFSSSSRSAAAFSCMSWRTGL